MVDNSWAYELPTLIYSLVKAKSETKIKKISENTKKVKFTTTDRASGTPIYPTVYIHEVGGGETGQDLKGDSINAVNLIMQAEVITDTSQNEAKKIMGVLIDAFKSMYFSVNQIPNFDNGSTYFRLVIRCQRIIGNGDTF